MLKISDIKTKKIILNSSSLSILEDYLEFSKELLSDNEIQLSDVVNDLLTNIPESANFEKIEERKESISIKIMADAAQNMETLSKKNSLSEGEILDRISEVVARKTQFRKWKPKTEESKEKTIEKKSKAKAESTKDSLANPAETN